MAHKKLDLVWETSTSTGNGNLSLAGAYSASFRTFANGMSNGDTCYVTIINRSVPSEREVVLATYVSAGNQLSLSYDSKSYSSTGALINFSAGTKDIYLCAPAGRQIVEDPNGDAAITRHIDVAGDIKIGSVAAITRSGNYTLVWTPNAAAAFQLGNASDPSSYHLSDAHFFQSRNGGTTFARINSTGLGVGISPAAPLHVSGTFLMENHQWVNWKDTGGAQRNIMRLNNGGGLEITNNNAGTGGPIILTVGSTEEGRFSGSAFQPGTDNLRTLGGASNRWSTVYAGTGAINTSGRASKRNIRQRNAAEARVAARLKAGGFFYQFADAVEKKGDAARLHFGVVAEDVAAAFRAEGLDPARYAMFCEDRITRLEEYEVDVERQKMAKRTVVEKKVEIVDGRPVLKSVEVERDEPVGQMVQAVGEDGAPVFDLVDVKVGETDDGEPVVEKHPVPLMHFVPEMETVKEKRTRQVETDEVRLGLRYDQLTLFVLLAG